MSLPEFVVFTQVDKNGAFKVLQPTGDHNSYYCFKFSDQEGVFSPRVKFAVENADNGLVHIRHCYTNKYLAKASASENWIAAVAEEPVEDKTSERCTSFRPRVEGNTVEFVHVSTNSPISVGQPNADADRFSHHNLIHLSFLHKEYRAGITSKDITIAKSNFIDHSSLVVLPKLVAFKGDNGKYLRWHEKGSLFLAFDCADPKEQRANFEIIPLKNGHICIKRIGVHSLTNSPMYWSCNNPNGHDALAGFINVCSVPDGAFSYVEKSESFHYQVLKTKLDEKDNTIALRSKPSGLFLKRVNQREVYTMFWGDQIDYLKAATPTITNEAQFEVTEPILDRVIEVKEYRLEHRRVSKTIPLKVDGSEIPNYDYKVTRQQTFKSDRTDSTSRKWTNSVTVHTSVNTIFKGSIKPKFNIPKVGDADLSFEVNYLSEVTDVKSWENVDIKSSSSGIEEHVSVPPRQKAIIDVYLYEFSTEIPFSYKQIDKLSDATVVETDHDDGVFKSSGHKYVSSLRYEKLN